MLASILVLIISFFAFYVSHTNNNNNDNLLFLLLMSVNRSLFTLTCYRGKDLSPTVCEMRNNGSRSVVNFLCGVLIVIVVLICGTYNCNSSFNFFSSFNYSSHLIVVQCGLSGARDIMSCDAAGHT